MKDKRNFIIGVLLVLSVLLGGFIIFNEYQRRQNQDTSVGLADQCSYGTTPVCAGQKNAGQTYNNACIAASANATILCDKSCPCDPMIETISPNIGLYSDNETKTLNIVAQPPTADINAIQVRLQVQGMTIQNVQPNTDASSGYLVITECGTGNRPKPAFIANDVCFDIATTGTFKAGDILGTMTVNLKTGTVLPKITRTSGYTYVNPSGQKLQQQGIGAIFTPNIKTNNQPTLNPAGGTHQPGETKTIQILARPTANNQNGVSVNLTASNMTIKKVTFESKFNVIGTCNRFSGGNTDLSFPTTSGGTLSPVVTDGIVSPVGADISTDGIVRTQGEQPLSTTAISPIFNNTEICADIATQTFLQDGEVIGTAEVQFSSSASNATLTRTAKYGYSDGKVFIAQPGIAGSYEIGGAADGSDLSQPTTDGADAVDGGADGSNGDGSDLSQPTTDGADAADEGGTDTAEGRNTCGPADAKNEQNQDTPDGKFTLSDFGAFALKYNSTCEGAPIPISEGCGGKDVNGDGKIGLIDFSNLALRFSTPANPKNCAVEE